MSKIIDTLIEKYQFEDKEVLEEKIETINEEEESTESKRDRYMKFFRSKLEKYGVSSPAELSDDKKSQFFEEIKRDWKG